MESELPGIFQIKMFAKYAVFGAPRTQRRAVLERDVYF